MNTRDFVANLDYDQRRAIMEDQIKLERDGFIGDSYLRRWVKVFMNELDIKDNTSIWIQKLVNGIHRKYAYRYFHQITSVLRGMGVLEITK